MKKNFSGYIFLLFIILFSLGIVAYFYYDRQNAVSTIIQKLGFFGVILSVVLMAVLCMTPIPSEGLLVVYLKIYGVYWGTILGWLGSNFGALLIFFFARNYGQRFLEKIVKPERYRLVDNWVQRKGNIGLFVVRLLPIPAFAVNYAAGVIQSVRFWPYLWTAAVSIIPYYIGTALVFLGVSQQVWVGLAVGTVIILVIWGISYRIGREKLPLKKSND